ncbi:MAG: nucleoside hydrolase [Acidobacteria bacterium]|nr:MAG: nucleoside hydrolase [Acidobacteriota bacterium]
MSTTPIQLVMDVDTGVDDALALLLAIHSPEIQLLGVTTVSGNTSARQAALNTLFLFDLFSKLGSIPVAAGRPASLLGRTERDPWDVHGRDGLGGVYERYVDDTDEYLRLIEPLEACDFLLETIAREPGLTVIATGPLTNVALAFQKDPVRFREVSQILVMGGAVEVPGNVTQYAEFNAHFDPLALDLVLRSGVPVVFYPLDVTLKASFGFSEPDLDRLLSVGKARLVYQLTASYIKFYRTHRGIHGLCMHDVHPVAGLLQPALYRFKEGQLVAVTNGDEFGRLRWARPGEKGTPARIAVGIDREAFLALFLDRLGKEPPVCLFGGTQN